MRPSAMSVSCLCCLLATLAGCRDAAPTQPPQSEQEPPTNRIATPEIVRRNLGIEFAAVERRRVAATLRVPGHFELLPNGRREYRAPFAGRVDLRTTPLQTVVPGTVLFSLEAPQWRTLQRELGELQTAVQVMTARAATMAPLLAAHAAHEQSLQTAIAVAEAQVTALTTVQRDVGGQGPELAAARLQVAQLQAELAEADEKHAELEATSAQLAAELAAGHDRFELAVAAAATVLGRAPAELTATAGEPPLPRWRTLSSIEVVCTDGGLTDRVGIASGAWVDAGDRVLEVVDLQQVRFRARGLQSDLARLRSGLPARVVRPHGDTAAAAAIAGELALGSEADPAQRTIDVFLLPAAVPDWARPGVAGFLEVETDGTATAELAIPSAAVLQDGLQRVFFRRDPADPDRVIRVEADLGIDDGRWIEVKSGLRDGDAVVLAGAYELMLASSGSAGKGGHFHADGTFHEDHE